MRIAIICILLMLRSIVWAQNLTQADKEILVLQDTRSLGENNKLLAYLNSESTEIVKRCLIALANISDTNTIDGIAESLLSNENSEIREFAAFALGQIPNIKSAEYLVRALKAEQNTGVICRILEALGKTGTEEDLNGVCDYQSENDSVKAAIAMSIARFGMRKVKNERGFEKLDSLTNVRTIEVSIQETVLRNVAYAYNRIGDEKFLKSYGNNLEKLAMSDMPEARMWALSAMGKAKDKYSPMMFEKALKDHPVPETDWRVRISLLNTHANFNYRITPTLRTFVGLERSDTWIERLVGGIDDSNESISLLIIQNLGKIFADTTVDDKNMKRVKKKLADILENKKYSFRQKSEAATALALIFKDKMKNDLTKFYRKINDWDVKAGIVRAFGEFENGRIYKHVRELISDDVQEYAKKNPGATNTIGGSKDLLKIYRAFIEMLTSLDKKVNDEERNNIRLMYSEFLSSRDQLITDYCLSALQDSIYLKYRDETKQILLFDYNEILNQVQPFIPFDSAQGDNAFGSSQAYNTSLDILQMYIQAIGDMKIKEAMGSLEENLKSESYDIAKVSADALKKITGEDYESTITALKYRSDFDWDYIEGMKNKKYVTMKTNKGEIKLELFPEFAPFTVQSFLKLSEKGYYNGTIFHRVVPNFVIQGGDPTGTGYSGPGYSIRSEFFPATYETGYLGMASSGKDTEGSQFFITHSPQPHLDGRYTIFGKVIKGMDVADRIQVGDILEEVRIQK